MTSHEIDLDRRVHSAGDQALFVLLDLLGVRDLEPRLRAIDRRIAARVNRAIARGRLRVTLAASAVELPRREWWWADSPRGDEQVGLGVGLDLDLYAVANGRVLWGPAEDGGPCRWHGLEMIGPPMSRLLTESYFTIYTYTLRALDAPEHVATAQRAHARMRARVHTRRRG